MKTTILNLVKLNTELKSCYGGQKILITYELTTMCEHTKNIYIVVAEVRGLDVAEPYLDVYSIEAETNNENTLVDDAIIDLLDF